MLWDTLVAKVKKYIAEHTVLEDGVKAIYDAAWKADMTGEAYMDQLPASEAQRIRDLVPEAFPKALQKGDLVVTQNIHGAWRVDPKE